MTTVSPTADEQPFSPLVGQILTNMFERNASVTAQVMDNYERQIEDLKAELYAIRAGVSELLAGRYMPMPDAIRDAVLFPAQKLIDEYEANKEVRW